LARIALKKTNFILIFCYLLFDFLGAIQHLTFPLITLGELNLKKKKLKSWVFLYDYSSERSLI